MDAVQLAQTVDLLNKVGKNTDASGTTTLFARLQQLSDYVDTLETKLGLNSDSSGTTTLFARMAQIVSYVDTLETNVGLNSDDSGTTTLFARLKQIVDYVDTVETTLGTVNTNVNTANTTLGTVNTNVSANATKIGANTDASGTSTLFALLKKLDAKASGTNFAGLTPNIQKHFNSSGTNVGAGATLDLLTVNGAGYLGTARVAIGNGMGSFVVCFVIDGVETEMTSYSANQYGVFTGGASYGSFNTAVGIVWELTGVPIRFNSSFTIRVKNKSAGAVNWGGSTTNAGAAELITLMG